MIVKFGFLSGSMRFPPGEEVTAMEVIGEVLRITTNRGTYNCVERDGELFIEPKPIAEIPNEPHLDNPIH